jgi:hypothetical protein
VLACINVKNNSFTSAIIFGMRRVIVSIAKKTAVAAHFLSGFINGFVFRPVSAFILGPLIKNVEIFYKKSFRLVKMVHIHKATAFSLLGLCLAVTAFVIPLSIIIIKISTYNSIILLWYGYCHVLKRETGKVLLPMELFK